MAKTLGGMDNYCLCGIVARRAFKVYWPKRLGELKMALGSGKGDWVTIWPDS
jgi:hypothetical protein